MRMIFTRGICAAVCLTTLALGCEPAPPVGGRFWMGSGGAGSIPDPATGSGGAGEDPGGTGGADPIGEPGTGGAVGSGGASLGTGGTGAGAATGSGGSPATGGGAGGSGVSGSGGDAGVLSGTLRVSVTTKAAGGRYSPDNVGAIWIADSGTKFVKSLYVWGSQRRRELSTWGAATSAAGMSNNLVDAVTAATMRSHGLRMATWNGTNTNRAAVPDGPYKVCFELRDGNGQSQCVDFMKSRTAQTMAPADTTSFTKRTIGYTP